MLRRTEMEPTTLMDSSCSGGAYDMADVRTQH